MRNVVLITIDSLRADHCSFHGYHRNTTPTLDRMAEEGLAFENAIAPGPSTPESMPAVMTSSYPVDTGESHASLLAKRRTVIRRHMKTRETLAERFRKQGYATAGFSPNPYTSRYFGFDVGFDRYEDFIEGSRETLYNGMLGGFIEGTPLDTLFPARFALNLINKEEVFKPWENFYKNIVEWTKSSEKPYFLWVLLMDTHDPYLAPAAYRTQSRLATYQANWRLWRTGHAGPFDSETLTNLICAYDDTITYADAFLNRLRTDLQGDNPLIAVHGDHGEAFGEHGSYGHHPRLYEENVHVPLVVGGTPTETVSAPFSLRSMPDLLAKLALGDEPSLGLMPAISYTSDGEMWALHGSDWKYLYTDISADSGESTPPTRTSPRNEHGTLYHLTGDPEDETNVLYDQYREACCRLVANYTEANHERNRLALAAQTVVQEGRT